MAAVILMAATLVACHSLPALHYYALDAVSPAGTAGAPAVPLLVRVRHVGVPREMDHLGLTHHTGATQLSVSDQDQWTAPLDVLIQGAMTRDLGARLGYEHVVAADALPVAAQSTLDLDFVLLSADDRCGITAQVNWTFSVPNSAARRGTTHLEAPASGCPAGLPAALSTALGDLADHLVTALTAA
jgi:uncharacterized lipoprotein YmbA